MLNPDTWSVVHWPETQPPLLIVVVDTEAEFDWSQTGSRRALGVKSMRRQSAAHRIFSRFGIRPTYVLDYPVSSQEEGYQPIRELLSADLCVIGAHLQPWDTPPILEELNDEHSYPGNLPDGLERRKLLQLTQTIEDNLHVRPRIYKAGRYGVGRATSRVLVELGYDVDLSVLPGTDLRRFSGPDFRHCGARPYWCGPDRRLFEIPLSVGFTGALARYAPVLHRLSLESPLVALHAPGVLARLRLLDRVTLTPEGVTFAELCRLTKALLRSKHRVFSFTYHSPSLAPGNTPYVRSEADLSAFLGRMEQFFEFFMGEIGGKAATPFEVRELARTSAHPVRNPVRDAEQRVISGAGP